LDWHLLVERGVETGRTRDTSAQEAKALLDKLTEPAIAAEISDANLWVTMIIVTRD
jgi:hypothetical protein